MNASAVRVEEVIINNERDSFRASQALHEEFIIIPRTDLPDFKIIDRKGEMHVDCGSDWGTWNVKHVDRMRETALEYVGAWLTAEEVKAQAEAAALNVRRDEIADQFTNAENYAGVGPSGQKLIDRIIELEQAAS